MAAGRRSWGRGFAQPLLQRRFSALTAALVIGGVWAFWHLPLFLSPAAPHSRWPLGQQLLWGVSIAGFSVILDWLFNSTRSAWLAMLMHGSINVTSMLMPIDPAYVDAGEVIYGQVVIAAMIASVAAVALVAVGLVMRYGGRDLAAGAVADAGTRPLRPGARPDATRTIGSWRAP